MSDLSSVRKLFLEYPRFGDMNSAQKAAFRARLTRYLNQVEDEQVKGALLKLQSAVGESETKVKEKLTVEAIESEFVTEYGKYDTKRRGAFKAKVARLIGEANEAGDSETAQRLATIRLKWLDGERKDAKSEILNLANLLGTEQPDEGQPEATEPETEQPQPEQPETAKPKRK